MVEGVSDLLQRSCCLKIGNKQMNDRMYRPTCLKVSGKAVFQAQVEQECVGGREGGRLSDVSFNTYLVVLTSRGASQAQ